MKAKAATQPIMRALQPADLPEAHGLSQAVSWPHRAEDWAFALSLGDGLALELGGRLVGTAMSWPFGERWGALGMVIVAPELQGRGLGRRLMDAAVAQLGERGIQLHATPAGEPLYRSFGFVATATIRQHQGAAFSVGLVPPRAGERLRPAGHADLPVLERLDAAATGMARGAAIATLLREAEAIVLDRDGVASGFAMLRRFGRGQVIGPVIAPDQDAARLLVAHWLGQRQGEFIRIDVTEDSALSPWLEAAGLPEVDLVTRMVRGTPPAPAAVRAFGLISQALG
jgi:predicted N-acetyltransferase YhbS